MLEICCVGIVLINRLKIICTLFIVQLRKLLVTLCFIWFNADCCVSQHYSCAEGRVCLWSIFITKAAFYCSRLKSKMDWHFGPNTCLKCKSVPQRVHYLTVVVDCIRKRIHSLSC